jgi:hypothetical protein
MTRSTRDFPTRARGELNRDHGSPRLSFAIDAQRRLNARRLDDARSKADPHGPSDPRHELMTRKVRRNGLVKP